MELGDGVPEDVNTRVQLVWKDISSYCEMINNSIAGKHDQKLQGLMDKLQNQSMTDDAGDAGSPEAAMMHGF